MSPGRGHGPRRRLFFKSRGKGLLDRVLGTTIMDKSRGGKDHKLSNRAGRRVRTDAAVSIYIHHESYSCWCWPHRCRAKVRRGNHKDEPPSWRGGGED